MNQTKNTYATVSLILGILSIVTGCFCLGGILGILGIVFFVLSQKSNGRTGAATAGLITSIVGILIALVMLYIINLSPSTDTNTNTATKKKVTETTEKASSTTLETESATTEAVALTPFDVELSAGHYTVGVDLPAGTYTIVCTSGYGNVSSTNMYDGGLNEIMSADTSDGYSIDTFNNAKFEDGDVFTVASTAVVKLSSDGVDTNSLNVRTPSGTEIELSSGNFIAGKDFEPGVYTITCVSGSGNVSSDNMYDGGLNEIMSVDTSNGFGITTFNNAVFDEGAELKVSGCTIKLSPSK